jgi:BASS family bile acid:Na+ symporter
MSSPIPSWLALLIAATVFLTMLSLGLLLGREQIEAALRRRVLLAALLFGTLIPVPLIAVLAVKLLGITGVAAAGIVLMAISPGAPVAMRRALEAGGHSAFAPALHLAIVLCAVVTVPVTVAILDIVFDKDFSVSPLDIARQVFFAQLLPVGLGIALRAWRPAVAARIEERLARLANMLLLGAVTVLLVVLWRLLEETGWVPIVAGALLTVCALLVGAAFAWRDAAVRPAAAVAAAMRNPGLALLIAALNKMPTGVVAAVFGYTLGAAIVITLFVAWQGRPKSSALSLSRSVT